MNQIVRAFPLLEGREEDLERFALELSKVRGRDATAFFARFGVARESWHSQRTDNGTWIICVTEIHERPPEVVAEEYASSELEFDRWFKSQVEHLTGINPDSQPLGPPTECIFDSENIEVTEDT